MTFDGLMVRRRVALAVRADENTDIPVLRAELEQRATDASLTLSDIASEVLPVGLLDQAVPAPTMLLPAGTEAAQARALVGPAVIRPEESVSTESATEDPTYFVVDVLVHDLRFEVEADEPAQAADLIATEGIVADAIGSYGTALGDGLLAVDYVGPLLSDRLIESVRIEIARGAGTAASQVAVRPESLTGVGVDMATEPFPAPAAIAQTMVDHVTDVMAPVPVTPSPWIGYWIGLSVLLSATMAIVLWSGFQRRRRTLVTVFEQEQSDQGSP
ncbi:hypothetical protein [Cryobacterium sp. TMT1-66-1]|uniref:hypothetical protein n=1 Tax=Cryobacterium sp. TMT1-66-1 TaxID=1259242 RepID=UPI00106B3705|nr:hypothetical protein [Cryobacterium sp. TMT1-66-1]TFD07681.1 hypothetical protein E3T29_07350 [Cryobacterium sp. TMT1-66-1]